MARPPSHSRPGRDALSQAEAAFKAATTKPVEAPAPTTVRAAALPHIKEQVTLRLDQDLLEHFREDGPGWQERLNAALRKAVGL